MSKVTLSNATVEITDHLTWGQKEAINSAMFSGMKIGTKTQEVDFNAEALLAAKYKTLEVCVLKITEGDKDVPFSKEWMDSLSIEDGDKLYDAVEAVTKPEKNS